MRYSMRALDDIDRIVEYRAREHSLRVAGRVKAAIRAAIDLFAANPEFRNETDHRRAMRRWPMGEYPYTIFYSGDRSLDAITIVRVIASAQVKDLRKAPN
jgi:plasmid stabilization system protein ParE